VSTGGDAGHRHGIRGAGQPDRRSELQHHRRGRPTNTVGVSYYRGVAVMRDGTLKLHRGPCIRRPKGGRRSSTRPRLLYTPGNAGNGGNLSDVSSSGPARSSCARAGTRIRPQPVCDPGGRTRVTQLVLRRPTRSERTPTSRRVETTFDNVVYLTKGSGGNGVNRCTYRHHR